MSLDGINGRLIQTLLRGENDSKQLNEIQAKKIPPKNVLHLCQDKKDKFLMRVTALLFPSFR